MKSTQKKRNLGSYWECNFFLNPSVQKQSKSSEPGEILLSPPKKPKEK